MKNKKDNEKEKIESEICNLEKEINQSNDNQMIIEIKKEELSKLRDKKMEGVLLRSRARWIADGEKVTKYFCNLENRHYISKTMLKVKGQDDQDITDNKKIINAVKDFYTNLF